MINLMTLFDKFFQSDDLSTCVNENNPYGSGSHINAFGKNNSITSIESIDFERIPQLAFLKETNTDAMSVISGRSNRKKRKVNKPPQNLGRVIREHNLRNQQEMNDETSSSGT